MQFSIPHKQTQVAAITFIKKMLSDHRAELATQVSDMKEDWQGNVLHFAFVAQKQKISGTVDVRDHTYEIDVKLPLMLRMFEGRIKKQIEEEAKKLVR